MSEVQDRNPLHAKPIGHELLDWLYARANEVFDRAGLAFERRDLVAHTEAFEEHKVLSAMIREVSDGTYRPN